MRLLCDGMLGRLARWLRLLGADVAYEADAADDALLARALAEDRVLLTRDVQLAGRAPPGRALLVVSLDPAEQLRQVARALGLPPEEALLSRCSVCNEPLLEASPAEAAGRVPAEVLARHDRFWRCPRCARTYWRGTHVARIEAEARALRGPG